MVDKNLDTSNKKNAGKGNGNTVINNSTNESAKNYVSGDSFPSSVNHKFNATNQDKDDDLE